MLFLASWSTHLWEVQSGSMVVTTISLVELYPPEKSAPTTELDSVPGRD